MINRTQHKSKAPDSKQRWHRPPSNEGGFFTWLAVFARNFSFLRFTKCRCRFASGTSIKEDYCNKTKVLRKIISLMKTIE